MRDVPDDDSLLREVASAPPVPVPADVATLVLLEPGAVVDGAFRIEERLGAGGMGVVYAARDLTLDREVALKLMRIDRAIDGRKLPEAFEREARATARLNHPNIVTLHQFGRWNGVLYLVLERLRGETLAARLERGAVSIREGLAIVEQVARALVHTHAAGITHRDLKPSNVFVLADGTVKVLDFGVSGLGRASSDARAREASDERRSTMSLAGTPGYMAPEQWHGGPQDARTDVFAVGVMLYQLVTGTLPFATAALDETATVPAIVDRDDSGLATLIARCLAPDRGTRLGSADELVRELVEIRGRLDDRADRDPVASSPSLATARIRPRHRRARVATFAAASLAAGTIVFATVRGTGNEPACDGERDVAEIWNAASRIRVRAVFAGPLGAATWTEVERTLDRYAAELATVRDKACRDRAPAVTACIDSRLIAFHDLIERLPATDPEGAVDAASVLPSPADCVDPAHVAGHAPGPTATPLRDPGGAVPMALTFGGPADEMFHAGAFVDGDLVLVGYAGPQARLLDRSLGIPTARRDGPRTGVIARIALDGRVRWQSAQVASRALAVAATGGALVVGGFTRRGNDLGVTLAPDNDDIDCYVAVLDAATGTPRWVRSCGATRHSTARAVATDAAGNVYAVGDFSGRARFAGVREHDARATQSAPFVASWGPDGAPRWVVAGSGSVASRTWSVASTPNALVVATSMAGAGRFGDRVIEAGGCVIARLDPDTGAIRWLVEDAGEAGRCSVSAIAAHGDRVAVIGQRAFKTGGGWVGELELATGRSSWRRAIGTGDHPSPRSIAYAPDGTLAVAGAFIGRTLAVDDVVLVGHRLWQSFVLRFAPGGRCLGGLGFGGTSSTMTRWIGYGPADRLFVGGRFQINAVAGTHDLRAQGGTDGFVFEVRVPPP